MSPTLPKEHRALVLEEIGSKYTVKTIPTPTVEYGTAVVQVLAAGILSYHREIHNGERKYTFPLPLVGGYSAVGRIAGLPKDATALQHGQLVFVDCVIRARDDPNTKFLTALHMGPDEGSKKLFSEVFRDGAFAEYMRVPLENCIPLDEEKLCKGLGYSIPDLVYISLLLVAFGGLRDIRLEPGETVVVAPATGAFGGAGVQVAASMGARVIAMGRNTTELARIKKYVEHGTPGARVETVQISGDEKTDTTALQAFAPIDAVLDLPPPAAAKSTHLRSAISVLRQEGRVSMMGNPNLPTSFWHIIGHNIALKGKLMYSREDMLLFVKMLERGIFPRGGDFVVTKVFKLEEWGEAFDVAAEHTGLGKMVVFVP